MYPKSAKSAWKHEYRILRVLSFGLGLMFTLVLEACVTPDLKADPSAHPLTLLPLTTAATLAPPTTKTPLLTPTSLPPATLTPIPNTQTNTPVPQYTLTPLITPPELNIQLRFDGWSPDGQWLAYWLGEGYGDGEEILPASLAFFEVPSGETCLHKDVISPNLWDGHVHWQEGGHVVVVLQPGGQTLAGAPCETFTPSEPLSQPIGELSPDGRYRVDHVPEYLEGGFVHFDTTIIDLTNDQNIASLSWDFAPNSARREGPGWINNNLYIIGPTQDQGLLYISVPEGSVGNVLTDLMGLDATYAEEIWSIFSQANLDTGGYHLLLKWEGGPTPLSLFLYHGELDQVEELPFYSAWPFAASGLPSGFSPGGTWLLLGDPLEENYPEQIGEDYWLRPVDPLGSGAIEIAKDMHPGGLSLETNKMAFSNGRFLTILGMPTGEVLSQWSASNYEFVLQTFTWSPDGNRLAFLGINTESNQNALFVIEP